MPETLESLKSAFQAQADRVRNFHESFDLTAIGTEIGTLRETIDGLAEDGYRFTHLLLADLTALAEQYNNAVESIQAKIREEHEPLIPRFTEVRDALDATGEDEAALASMEDAIDDFERAIDSAERSVENLIRPITSGQSILNAQAGLVKRYLEAANEASFDFAPGENVVIADKAEWVATGQGKDDPDGVLFLTDQRLLFEQKEKTGKKLGLFGGQMQHELEWAIPLDQIAGVETEDKGLLGGKDMLMLRLQPGAQYGEITLKIKSADNAFWQRRLAQISGAEPVGSTNPPPISPVEALPMPEALREALAKDLRELRGSLRAGGKAEAEAPEKGGLGGRLGTMKKPAEKKQPAEKKPVEKKKPVDKPDSPKQRGRE